MKIAIMMALKQESQGLFERAGLQVCFCGIGKLNATQKVTELILQQKPEMIVNLGTAGSHKLKTHELIECSGFVDRDVDLSLAGIPLGQWPGQGIYLHNSLRLTKFPQGICGSADRLEAVPKLDCDLMDMEAFALATVAHRYQIPFVSIKYISDSSNENLQKDWKNHLQSAAKALLVAYQSIASN